MITGVVKWYDPAVQHGFITPAGATKREQDVFVHVSELKRSGLQSLAQGDRVSFDTHSAGRPHLAAHRICLLASHLPPEK